MDVTIYKIQNKINRKIYIGLTTKTPWTDRIMEHFYGRKKGRNYAIHHALVKYGLSGFHISQIDTAETKPELLEKEKIWIKHFRSCERGFGYNLASGGQGCRMRLGFTVSDETRKKLSIAAMGCKRHTTPHTEETKRRLSQMKMGIITPYVISQRKRVLCLDDNTTHESIEACAKRYGIWPQNLLKVCKGVRNKTEGLRFSFAV
jgi:group I intron endonuclease